MLKASHDTALLTASQELDQFGYSILRGIFSQEECCDLLQQLEQVMNDDSEQFSVRKSRGTVFAARNLIDLFPDIENVWKQKPQLVSLLSAKLGAEAGLVRVLFFDKPSDRSWSLPFHKDMTIAVQNNKLPTGHFTKPTTKAGVPHVEGSEELLSKMLTLRIHLDEITEDNGPLQVIPGSHTCGKSTSTNPISPIKILSDAGDVLAMRPLISHASAHSTAGKNLHRRILHLEFAASSDLPDGYQWHRFLK